MSYYDTKLGNGENVYPLDQYTIFGAYHVSSIFTGVEVFNGVTSVGIFPITSRYQDNGDAEIMHVTAALPIEAVIPMVIPAIGETVQIMLPGGPAYGTVLEYIFGANSILLNYTTHSGESGRSVLDLLGRPIGLMSSFGAVTGTSIIAIPPGSVEPPACVAPVINALAQIDYAYGNHALSVTPTLASGNGTIIWALVSSAIAGVSVDSSTGHITASITTGMAPINGNIVISATNGCGNYNQTLTVTMPGVCVAPAINALADINYANGSHALSVTPTLSAGNGTIVWSLSGTPPVGVSINSVTGEITATITPDMGPIDWNLSVTAANSCGFSLVFLVVTMAAPACVAPVIITLADVTRAYGNYSFEVAPTLSAGNGTIVWSLVAPPAGVSIDPDTGLISIVITTDMAPIAATVTVNATNGCGTGSRSFVLTMQDIVDVQSSFRSAFVPIRLIPSYCPAP